MKAFVSVCAFLWERYYGLYIEDTFDMNQSCVHCHFLTILYHAYYIFSCTRKNIMLYNHDAFSFKLQHLFLLQRSYDYRLTLSTASNNCPCRTGTSIKHPIKYTTLCAVNSLEVHCTELRTNYFPVLFLNWSVFSVKVIVQFTRSPTLSNCLIIYANVSGDYFLLNDDCSYSVHLF